MGGKKRPEIFRLRLRDTGGPRESFRSLRKLYKESPIFGIDVKPVDFDPFPTFSKDLEELGWGKALKKRLRL